MQNMKVRLCFTNWTNYVLFPGYIVCGLHMIDWQTKNLKLFLFVAFRVKQAPLWGKGFGYGGYGYGGLGYGGYGLGYGKFW